MPRHPLYTKGGAAGNEMEGGVDGIEDFFHFAAMKWGGWRGKAAMIMYLLTIVVITSIMDAGVRRVR